MEDHSVFCECDDCQNILKDVDVKDIDHSMYDDWLPEDDYEDDDYFWDYIYKNQDY